MKKGEEEQDNWGGRVEWEVEVGGVGESGRRENGDNCSWTTI